MKKLIKKAIESKEMGIINLNFQHQNDRKAKNRVSEKAHRDQNRTKNKRKWS